MSVVACHVSYFGWLVCGVVAGWCVTHVILKANNKETSKYKIKALHALLLYH
jgi:hypothetical protein